MLNKEKCNLIVKLLKEGYTNREICKTAKCSPNEITPIRKTIFGENTDTSADMKGKSICAQVFDLLEKGYSLAQIVIIVDIDPEEAIRLQDKYHYVTKRDKILNLLKDKNDLDSTIEILEFLKINPKYCKKIKEIKDLEIIIEELKADREEIEEDIHAKKIIDQYYDRQLQLKEKLLGLPNKY
jgi:DNA-binding CsgD family transcriptional regulator